jgi:tRNA pseudouridine38-40 synthase
VRRIRLLLEYDGTDFVGWQVQSSGRSVQGELEAAIGELAGRGVRVHGAGRTDAGVHATGQMAHFDWDGRLTAAEIRQALNARLAADLCVVEAAAAPDDFDARRDATSKRYVYRLLCRTSPSPLRRRRVWHLRRRLDLRAMQRGAAHLVGSHDFEAFRGARGGPPPDQSTCRSLDVLHVYRRDDEFQLRAEGRSFLRYMVRNLVGTLVEVGAGRRDPDDLPKLLADRDRSRAAATAPPHGLCLEAIRYPEARLRAEARLRVEAGSPEAPEGSGALA